jgi:hypothetical protein
VILLLQPKDEIPAQSRDVVEDESGQSYEILLPHYVNIFTEYDTDSQLITIVFATIHCLETPKCHLELVFYISKANNEC